MFRITATIACLLAACTATAARGAWVRVLDLSTASTCRDAEGIAFRESNGTFWAISGSTLCQFGGAAGPLRAVELDEEVAGGFNGVEALASGNLLLVSAQTRRLYEITPDGQTIAVKKLGDRVMPQGVAHCPRRNRVYVLDGTDRSIREYSAADEPEAFYKIRLPDARALVVPRPGVLWVLDGWQHKVFAYRPGGTVTELLDLRQFCNYDGPTGLAWDRSRSILFVCFARSQRIVGLVEAGPGIIERAELRSFVHPGSTNRQPHRIVHLPPQAVAQMPSDVVRLSGRVDLAKDPAAEVLPAPKGDELDTDDQTPQPKIQIPSPHSSSTIVVKPPYPPTIYVLPLIVRGDPIGSVPIDGHVAASPGCLPDLTVSDLEVLSVDGGRIKIRYLVSNPSGVPVNLDGVIVHAVASTDHRRNMGDRLVADHAFYGELLGPGQSRYVTDTGVLRQGFADRPFLIVELDTADRVAESNEENNAAVTLTTFAR